MGSLGIWAAQNVSHGMLVAGKRLGCRQECDVFAPPHGPAGGIWPLWNTRGALTSSSSRFSSCGVAVFLFSLSSCSWPTQAPCPCQDWKNPSCPIPTPLPLPGVALALPSAPGAAQHSLSLPPAAVPGQALLGHLEVTSPSSAGPCGTGDGCPRCVPAVPAQSCARDTSPPSLVTPQPSSALRSPPGLPVSLSAPSPEQDPPLESPYLALSPRLQGLAPGPSSVPSGLLRRAQRSCPAVPWHTGLGSQTHLPLFHCFSSCISVATTWDTRTRAWCPSHIPLLPRSQQEAEPGESLHPSLPPQYTPSQLGLSPWQSPNPRARVCTLQGRSPFWPPHSPGDTGDPHCLGAATAVPAPVGKMAFGGGGPTNPQKPHRQLGLLPVTVSLALPCPFPCLSRPCTLLQHLPVPQASPDSLLLLSAPSLSVSSRAKVAFPPRPRRAGGSCRLMPRAGCLLVVALLALGKLLPGEPVLAPALLLPAETPGVLQECPGKAVANRSPRGGFLRPRAGWAEGDAQGTPQDTPTRLRREILAPRDSRLSLLLRGGDLSCPGALPRSTGSCGRRSRLLPVGNKDSSCPGPAPSLGTCPAGSCWHSRGSTIPSQKLAAKSSVQMELELLQWPGLGWGPGS